MAPGGRRYGVRALRGAVLWRPDGKGLLCCHISIRRWHFDVIGDYFFFTFALLLLLLSIGTTIHT